VTKITSAIWISKSLVRRTGITGIQLDLKIDGISEEIVRATLKQAREARMEILRKMITAIPRPRSETSRFAPRLLRTKIDVRQDRHADRAWRQEHPRDSGGYRRHDRRRR
jgi:hypothetical protein